VPKATLDNFEAEHLGHLLMNFFFNSFGTSKDKGAQKRSEKKIRPASCMQRLTEKRAQKKSRANRRFGKFTYIIFYFCIFKGGTRIGGNF
jgi:hypothetical protein